MDMDRRETRPARRPAPPPVEVEEIVEEEVEPKHKYEELTPDEKLSKSIGEVNDILRNGRFEGQQQRAFDDFFNNYFLTRWTQVKNLGELYKYRKELRTSYLGKKPSSSQPAAQAHDHLNGLVLAFMKKILAGDYHPAIRVNAMLMVGDLNSVEQPPTPLPAALEVLRGALDDADGSDALKAAAMIGIQRHLAAKIADADARKATVATLTKVASADPPEGAVRAGREWILTQALDALASLGSVGEENAVFNAILKTLGNPKMSLSTRTAAAQSLGRLNCAGAAGINPAEAAKVVAQFAIDACADEQRLAKEKAAAVEKTTALPEGTTVVSAPIRRIRQRLAAALSALTGGGKGIASLAKDPAQKAFIANLQKDIQELTTAIDKRKAGDDFSEAISKLQGTLEELLKKNS